MTPRDRLSRYFELRNKRDQLAVGEFHEMCHLEEALIDDVEHIYSDEKLKIIWDYINNTLDLLVGDGSIVDAGSTWDLMKALASAVKSIEYKKRKKVQKIVSKPFATGWTEDKK